MNNEFAFPRIVPEGDTLQPGLTKREWFAGMALAACIEGWGGSLFTPDERTVEYCVDYADQLIKQLAKTN